MDRVHPPWTATLTQGQHDLILFGMVAAGLALLATLVRVRFTSRESHGAFRVASLTANAVVALAFASYLGLVIVFLLGYTERDGLYHPGVLARLAWELRYMDWVVTVPLLVIELLSISALGAATTLLFRRIGMASAVAMIVCGFLGAFVVDDGTDRTAYTLFGVAGAVFFALLYALFFVTTAASLPRLPEAARRPYRSAVVLLLITWLAYPVVYGLTGLVAGAAIAVAGQLILSTADMVAKIGFGTLVHRTSVLRSRNDEDLDPSTTRRPRAPVNDSVYVTDSRTVEFDSE